MVETPMQCEKVWLKYLAQNQPQKSPCRPASSGHRRVWLVTPPAKAALGFPCHTGGFLKDVWEGGSLLGWVHGGGEEGRMQTQLEGKVYGHI